MARITEDPVADIIESVLDPKPTDVVTITDRTLPNGFHDQTFATIDYHPDTWAASALTITTRATFSDGYQTSNSVTISANELLRIADLVRGLTD